jgi:hypothetical protein
MEENISREAGATAGQYTSPEDFQAMILEIGRIPAERNTKYSRMKIKLPLAWGRAPSRACPERSRRVQAECSSADADGYDNPGPVIEHAQIAEFA